ncbi:hypothetical protein RUND412_001233 [Rhizina undulata]
MADAQYDDKNRAFLQAFIARRVMKMDEMKSLVAAILSAADREIEIGVEDLTDQMVKTFIHRANHEINHYDFQIRSMLDQQDRTRIYALVNTTSDELIQLATNHSADEIAFFKRVLDMMFETNNTTHAEVMAVRSMDAVNLHKNPRSQASQSQPNGTQAATQSSTGLTMAGAEAALAAFVDEGWLVRSQAGFHSLSPRALLELNHYLIQTYNVPADEDSEDESNSGAIVERIKFCHACKEIVTIGKRCSSKPCNFRLHDPCAAHFFRVHKDFKKCPLCSAEWTGENHVGEKAFPQLRKVVTTTRRSINGRRTSTQQRTQREETEEEETVVEDGDEDSE